MSIFMFFPEPHFKSQAKGVARNKDDTSSTSDGKSLSVREQIRREKNRAAVKKCRKRKNERLKELESLTIKVRESVSSPDRVALSVFCTLLNTGIIDPKRKNLHPDNFSHPDIHMHSCNKKIPS